MKTFSIAVMPGDGIGKEIMPPCLDIIRQAAGKTGGFACEFTMLEAGAEWYRKTGEDCPEENFRKAEAADAILLGAMGLPDVRLPDGREVAPHLAMRERMQLFAGVRPVKVYPGIPAVLAHPRYGDIDFILVRESTEGLYASRLTGEVTDDCARDTLTLTRKGCERLFDFSFRLARRRGERGKPGLLTCVDKANVLRSFGYFRKLFHERAALFPDVRTECCHVDAMAMNMVKRPWDFDVMVTENMFGDILSDLGAGVMGGLGFAPSADIGENNAIFQPCHGTAPDIAGQGRANPVAMFLSAALMLDWLAERHGMPQAGAAAELIGRGVAGALASGAAVPYEFGGSAGTEALTKAASRHMDGA